MSAAPHHTRCTPHTSRNCQWQHDCALAGVAVVLYGLDFAYLDVHASQLAENQLNSPASSKAAHPSHAGASLPGAGDGKDATSQPAAPHQCGRPGSCDSARAHRRSESSNGGLGPQHADSTQVDEWQIHASDIEAGRDHRRQSMPGHDRRADDNVALLQVTTKHRT